MEPTSSTAGRPHSDISTASLEAEKSTGGKKTAAVSNISTSRELHHVNKQTILIPLDMADQLHLDQFMDDLKLSRDFERLFQLDKGAIVRVNELLQQTAAKLRAQEIDSMTVRKQSPDEVEVEISPLPHSQSIRKEFTDQLAETLGDERAALFLRLAQPTIRLGLSGDFGELRRRVSLKLSNGSYDVDEKIVTITSDGQELTTDSMQQSFRSALPQRLSHLFELGESK